MKRITIPVILFLVIAALAAVPMRAWGQETPDMKDGMAAFYDKDFDKATESFHNEFKKNPNNSLALLYLLDCYAQKKNLQPILNELEEQALADPGSALYKSQLGMGYFAMSLLKKDVFDESLNAFQEALKIDNNQAMGYLGMGIIYYKKRMIPRARNYFIKAVKLNPDDAVSCERLGEILMLDDKNPGAAREQFSHIIELYPSYPDGYFYYASASKDLGEIDTAIEFYEKTMALDPVGMGKGYYAPERIGDIYYENKKDNDKAAEFYQKALKVNPDNSYAKRMLKVARGEDDKDGKKDDGGEPKPKKKK